MVLKLLVVLILVANELTLSTHKIYIRILNFQLTLNKIKSYVYPYKNLYLNLNRI